MIKMHGDGPRKAEEEGKGSHDGGKKKAGMGICSAFSQSGPSV